MGYKDKIPVADSDKIEVTKNTTIKMVVSYPSVVTVTALRSGGVYSYMQNPRHLPKKSYSASLCTNKPFLVMSG